MHNHFPNRRACLLLMLVVGLLLNSGCQAGKQQASATGYLRNGTLAIIELPVRGTRREVIGVTESKVVNRSFIPLSSPAAMHSVIIPDPLWNDLEALRRAWCDHPPAFATGPLTDDEYRVTLNCGRFADPVFAVPPDQLPPALQELVQFIPPAP